MPTEYKSFLSMTVIFTVLGFPTVSHHKPKFQKLFWISRWQILANIILCIVWTIKLVDSIVFNGFHTHTHISVSYTHLDVYKRQCYGCVIYVRGLR